MRYWELFKAIMSDGKLVGARNLMAKELINVKLLCDDYNFFSAGASRSYEFVSNYLYGELAWYLSGDRNIKNIVEYSSFWKRIANPDGTANSNYGDLVFYRKNSHGITSFNWACEALMNDKHTRQGFVLYNDRELFYPNNKDLICNQSQHFLIRDNELICIVDLRSSDAIYGLFFNVPWWSLVHQQMFHLLKKKYPEIKLGRIEANIHSSHIYSDKFDLANKILEEEHNYHFLILLEPIPVGESYEWYVKNIKKFFREKKKK